MSKNKYRFQEVIGSGTFGHVEKWIIKKEHDRLPSTIAIKTFHHPEMETKLHDFIRETSILQSLKHPHIIDLLGYTNDKEMIVEHMHDTLVSLCTAEIGFEYAKRIYLMIADGIQYMHSQGFIHCDIKPANILCTDCKNPSICVVKIADFGLASRYIPGSPMTLYVQTRWYRAPEVILGDAFYTPAIDVWSVGLIYALLVGMDIFYIQGKDETEQIVKIFDLIGVPSVHDWTNFDKLPLWKQYNDIHKFSSSSSHPHIFDAISLYKDVNSKEEDVNISKKILRAALAHDPLRRYLITKFEYDKDDLLYFDDIQNMLNPTNPNIKGFSEYEISTEWATSPLVDNPTRLKILNEILYMTESLCLGVHIFQSCVSIFDHYILNNRIIESHILMNSHILCVAICCVFISISLYKPFTLTFEELLKFSVTSFSEKQLEDTINTIVYKTEFKLYNTLLVDHFNDVVPKMLQWSSNIILLLDGDSSLSNKAFKSLILARSICERFDKNVHVLRVEDALSLLENSTDSPQVTGFEYIKVYSTKGIQQHSRGLRKQLEFFDFNKSYMKMKEYDFNEFHSYILQELQKGVEESEIKLKIFEMWPGWYDVCFDIMSLSLRNSTWRSESKIRLLQRIRKVRMQK